MSLSEQASVDAFLKEHPELDMFEVILPDLNGNLRGKWIARDKLAKAVKGNLKLPLSSLAFDVWGRDTEACVFDSGDEDGVARVDVSTLKSVPWLEHPTGQALISLYQVDGQSCAYDGRILVQSLMARFASLGLTPVLACEMEFSLFAQELIDGVPQHTGEQADALVPGGNTYGLEAMQWAGELMHAIRDACVKQQLPIDTLIKESGPSQYEINLYHQADALQAADQALMLKRLIKGVAAQHGYRASFMAKPFGDCAGNGMHVHCSLLNADGSNAFDNGAAEGTPLLRHAIAGCLQHMSDSMLLFAPHLNSYRRFQRSSHAPLFANWGYENRTVAVRVPAGASVATRIEHRLAGADANPYLVIAGILAAMLAGIEGQLEAPEPVEGNAYAQDESTFIALPHYWPDAIECFSGSAFVEQYLGAEFQNVFSGVKLQELEEFNRHISTLEYQAYL